MNKKAQISAEFLVLLSVVLIVALVAIGLTFLFVQSSRDISENESRAYWASQPQPLRVMDYEAFYYSAVPASGQLAVVVENVDSKPITLRSFVISPYGAESTFNIYAEHSTAGSTVGLTLLGSGGPSNLTGLDEELAPSERKTFYIRTGTLCSNTGYGLANTQMFENNFTIYYDTPYFTGLSFEGVRSILGLCNPA